MSEFSLKMLSKKESLRCSRLQNAEKILQAVNEEKSNLLKLIDGIAAPVSVTIVNRSSSQSLLRMCITYYYFLHLCNCSKITRLFIDL